MGTIGVGIIGSGFMGRSHMLAFTIAPRIFPLALEPRLVALADSSFDKAQRMARQFGFARASRDWRELVRDPEVELVSITTPNHLHRPMALEAIAAGKHVYCEKPLAATAREAEEMAEAARRAGVVTAVGFNYQQNPIVRVAQDIIRCGEIGEIWSFRGIHAEDYMSDPERPWDWRMDPAGAPGVVGDLGSHIVSMARFLLGEIVELAADAATVIRERPRAPGSRERVPVEVPDEFRALLRFESGALGTVEASWIATGRKMYHAFEVTGSKGAIAINLERMNEMRLYLRKGLGPGREGFVEIPTGPEHPDYGAFIPAPAHQLGYNEIKAIEVRRLLEALAGGPRFHPDFDDAVKTHRVLDAIMLSAGERRWVRIADVS